MAFHANMFLDHGDGFPSNAYRYNERVHWGTRWCDGITRQIPLDKAFNFKVLNFSVLSCGVSRLLFKHEWHPHISDDTSHSNVITDAVTNPIFLIVFMTVTQN